MSSTVLHGRALPSLKCCCKLVSTYSLLAAVKPAGGNVGGRLAETTAPCLSSCSGVSSLAGSARTNTVPGDALENQKCWYVAIPRIGLNMVSRYAAQDLHSQPNITAWFGAHEQLTMVSTSLRLSMSIDRNFFFKAPKYPSTAQRVWPTRMKLSSMSSDRPHMHRQSM